MKSAFANKSAQKSTLKSTFGSSEPIWQEVENPDKIPEVLDNGDSTGNDKGCKDAGEEDVNGVGDQPWK